MQLPLKGVADGSLPPLLALRSTDEVKAGAEDRADTAFTVVQKLAVPVGLLVSGLIHLAVLTPAFILAGGSPFHTPPAEAITVDIVTPEEIAKPGEPPAPEEMPAKEASKETLKEKPQETFELPAAPAPAAPQPKTAAAAPTAPPAQPGPRTTSPVSQQTSPQQAPAMPPSVLPPPPFMQQQAEQPQQPPAEPQNDQAAMFGMPMTMPDGSVGGHAFDSQAVDRANVADDAVAAFRAHLKTCSKLPPGVARDVRVVVRIYLKPDGTLAAGLPANPEPIKVEGVSAGGGALYQNAAAALRKCQPYSMLPPDRYKEWRALDLTFTPQNF